jgi:hypothetical protein
MKSIEDMRALCVREHDNFYATAFMIECWLGEVVLEAAAQYAERKQANERRMQSGQCWRTFQRVFGRATNAEFLHLYGHLLRFAEYDDPQAAMLRRAIVPLSFEHECFADFVGEKTMAVAQRAAEGMQMLRRTVARWCAWLDALVHYETHAGYHLVPPLFQADPERRELGVLGVNQRHYADLGEGSKAWWHWHHGEASERFKGSPKWLAVGEAMASQAQRHWAYPELDVRVISLWPLVVPHNWTYRDLLNFLNEILERPNTYPCEREQDLATYCVNVLGLRKAGKGRTSVSGKPTGYEVARRVCNVPK